MNSAGPGTIEIAGKSVHRHGFGAMRLLGPSIWGDPAGRGPFIELMRPVVTRNTC